MIKICGITRTQDVEYINEAKPDYMGMILSPGFRRSISADHASRIISALTPDVMRVGVFVNEPVQNILDAAYLLKLDVIQLHGDEDRSFIEHLRTLRIPIWKAARVRSSDDINAAQQSGADCLLLDSYVEGVAGGTGKMSDWEMIKRTRIEIPFFLAGGINAGNLSEALTISKNIDISGGVETDGFKDRDKIKEVIEIYRNNLSIERI